ncbi:MAG: hypothetical protein Q8Q30_01905 [Candidatus Woesebacteria bacterium]|nr:hypothetical protein [Candidatus Woesebacteria bacterium]
MQERNLFISAIFILLFSAIFYYSGGNLTGYTVTKTDSFVGISPSETAIGEVITITIDPGKFGINQYGTFLNGVSQSGSIKLCQKTRCFESGKVEFKIPENWGEGLHSLKYYDYSTKSFGEVHFNIWRK